MERKWESEAIQRVILRNKRKAAEAEEKKRLMNTRNLYVPVIPRSNTLT